MPYPKQKQDHSIFLNTLKDKERKIKTKEGEVWLLMDLQIHKERKREGLGGLLTYVTRKVASI